MPPPASKRQRVGGAAAAAAAPTASGAAAADSMDTLMRQRIDDECLAGRLITRARLCKQVKTALETLGWRKESVKIRPVSLPEAEEPPPDDQATLVLALAPTGVRAVLDLLAAEHKQPPPPAAAASPQLTSQRQQAAREKLSALLRDGSVRFSPGLPCAAELGLAFPPSAAPEAEDAAAFALQPLDTAAAAGPDNVHKPTSFLFAELFAVSALTLCSSLAVASASRCRSAPDSHAYRRMRCYCCCCYRHRPVDRESEGFGLAWRPLVVAAFSWRSRIISATSPWQETSQMNTALPDHRCGLD